VDAEFESVAQCIGTSMADIMSKTQRSRRMASVRQRDTAPELALRKALHAIGLRFRVNVRRLPGSPDIVLPKYGALVFVHGCFWHGHHCAAGRPPATRAEYWVEKLGRNRQRDRRQAAGLRRLGWRVLTVWECQLKTPAAAERTAARLARRISRASALAG
jgi:DNA mismatch endonuclease, patch repair protein